MSDEPKPAPASNLKAIGALVSLIVVPLYVAALGVAFGAALWAVVFVMDAAGRVIK